MGRASAEARVREGAAVVVAVRGAEGVQVTVPALCASGVREPIATPRRGRGGVRGGPGAGGHPGDQRGRTALRPFLGTDDVGWDRAVQQNLLGTIRLMRAALPGMRQRG